MGFHGSGVNPRLSLTTRGAPRLQPGSSSGGPGPGPHLHPEGSFIQGHDSLQGSHLGPLPEGVKNPQVTTPAEDTGCHPRL